MATTQDRIEGTISAAIARLERAQRAFNNGRPTVAVKELKHADGLVWELVDEAVKLISKGNK